LPRPCGKQSAQCPPSSIAGQAFSLVARPAPNLHVAQLDQSPINARHAHWNPQSPTTAIMTTTMISMVPVMRIIAASARKQATRKIIASVRSIRTPPLGGTLMGPQCLYHDCDQYEQYNGDADGFHQNSFFP
jgi:hypothetical protein